MLFAIGDVHGCASELRLLINELPLTPETTVVFVGDYIDRGPDSKAVVDTVLELSEYCNVVTLMGNHEQMFLDYIDDPLSHGAGMFIYNGGSSTLQSYSSGDGEWTLPSDHLEFYRSLRLYYETDHDFFVHAGVPEVPLDEIDLEVHRKGLLWTRKPFLASTYRWSKMIIHGHSRVGRVDFNSNRINIDTGCVFNNELSALALPGQQVISVARQAVVKPVVLRDDSSRRAAVRFHGRLPVSVQSNGKILQCETIDFSELGMYLRSVSSNERVFSVGDDLAGVIGPGSVAQVGFTGRIVRVTSEHAGMHYAVQITQLIPRS